MIDEEDDESVDDGPVRLDKWLWAARFFRTRSLAKQAIEAGHVRYEGDRAKVSRAVAIGAVLAVRQGWDEREVVVRGLSEQRRGAPEAQLLYEETAQSRERREREALARKSAALVVPDARPDKKQRRELTASGDVSPNEIRPKGRSKSEFAYILFDLAAFCVEGPRDGSIH